MYISRSFVCEENTKHVSTMSPWEYWLPETRRLRDKQIVVIKAATFTYTIANHNTYIILVEW